jgi:hypothetical protein
MTTVTENMIFTMNSVNGRLQSAPVSGPENRHRQVWSNCVVRKGRTLAEMETEREERAGAHLRAERPR